MLENRLHGSNVKCLTSIMMVRFRLGYCLVAAKQLCHIQSSYRKNGSDKWRTYSIVPLCVSYSHEWGVQQQFFLALPPGALGTGQKVKYLISITKSISKIFIPNFVCVLTNERYQT